MENIEVDVVVVGGGMAGLTAALVAAEDGSRTLCLDRLSEPGGSLALSGGYLWTVGNMEEYRRLSPEGDADIGRMIIDDFDDGLEWLTEHGVDLMVVPTGMGAGRAFGGRRIRPDPVSGAVAPMVKAFLAAGGQLRTQARGLDIRMDDAGRVRGLRFRDRSGDHEVTCSAVVLATGGFQGDSLLTSTFFGPWADRAYVRSNPGSTGDGLRLATSAGAGASKGLSAFYGHLLPAPPVNPDPAAFRGLTQFYSEACIVLNMAGRRFVDESRGDEICALRLIREEEATGFFVFDEARHQSEVMEPYVPDAVHTDPLPGVRAAGGHVFEGESIEHLCRQLFDEYGVPAAQAAATIREFNDSWHSKDPSRLSVARREGLHACEQGPFYAVPVRPGITFTEGGVRANRDCQALDDMGRPISGLYVAGVDVGAVSIEGYVGGLAAGLMTGLRAGVNAARFADQAALSGQRIAQ
jgi:succinate dehydrogenase/fumarate reductase flavoprotein subunit